MSTVNLTGATFEQAIRGNDIVLVERGAGQIDGGHGVSSR